MNGRGSLRAWTCWSAAGTLVVANLFLHKPLSNLCDFASARLGFDIYDRAALIVITAVGLMAVVPAVLRGRRAPDPMNVGGLLALAAMTAAAQRWLLVANIELIHLPQFALLAGLLLVGGTRPRHAWLLATALGIVDEIYQWLVIYAGQADVYLDYNDMVLNAIGAAWAVFLIGYLWHPSARQSVRHSTLWADWIGSRWQALGFSLALLPFLWLDRPHLTPLLRAARTGHRYHILSAIEGGVIAAVLWMLVRSFTMADPAAQGTRAQDHPPP